MNLQRLSQYCGAALGVLLSLGCAAENGTRPGSESHFIQCKEAKDCPIGICEKGYCEVDGRRVTQEEIAAGSDRDAGNRSQQERGGIEGGKEDAGVDELQFSPTQLPTIVQLCGQRLPDAVPPTAPSICEWVASLDAIVIGTIAEVAAEQERYAISVEAAEQIAPLIQELGVEERVPWLEEVLSNAAESKVVVVPSCSEWTEPYRDGVVSVSAGPPVMRIGIRSVVVLAGSTPDAGDLKVHISISERRDWDSPRIRDGVVDQSGGEFALGTTLGVGLIQDHSGQYWALVNQRPFTVDQDGVIRTSEILGNDSKECAPSIPDELNGMKLQELQQRIVGCPPSEGTNGAVLRVERASSISLPNGFPPDTVGCGMYYSGSLDSDLIE